MTRSWLYVPGDRPDRIAKALASEADVVIIDLEDAVKPDNKAAARVHALAALEGTSRPQRWVRVNSGDDGRHDLDAMAAARVRPDGLVLAKCSSPSWIVEVHWSLPGIAVAPLVETAAALRDLDALEAMLQRPTPNRRIRVAQAAEPVDVILEEIRVDRTDPYALPRGEAGELRPVVDLVPRNVNGDARAGPGQLMNERGVGNPLIDRACRAWPWVDMEACAGVAISP